MAYHNIIFVHLGLPKTSTSHLQNNIFSKIKDENLIYNPEIFYEIIKLVNTNKINIEDTKVQILKEKINKFLKENHKKNFLLSDESLLFSGYGFVDINNKILLLNNLIPDAKFIITLREHKAWIISSYKQSIQQGNFQSFDDFIYFSDNKVSCMNTYECGILPKLNIKNISYKKLLSSLKKNFGKDNLFVFKYEDFFNEYNQTLKFLLNLVTDLKFNDETIKIFNATKIHYRSLSGLSIKIILSLNFLFRPLIKRMNYNHGLKLFNFDKQINYDCNILLKLFSWKYIRNLFQYGFDRLIYLDLNFEKQAEKKLKKYQNFFDEDDYNKLFD